VIDKITKFFKRPKAAGDITENAQAQENSGQNIKLQTVDERVASRRNKSILIITAVIGLILVAMSVKDMLMPFITGDAARKKQEDQRKAKLLEPPKGTKQGEMVDTAKLSEDWKTVMEKKVDELDKKYQQGEKEKEELREELKKEKQKDANTKAGYPQKPLKDIAPFPASGSDKTGSNYKNSQANPEQQQPQQKKAEPVVQPTFRSIEFKFDKPEAKKTSASDTQKSADNKVDSIDLPIGIAVGLTINGMDAPTFQWGQQDPQPLLISIEDKMVTAMGEEIDLKGCMVLSSAHGAVSAEKAMPRLVKMNCRDKNGNLYAGSVKGWILGDDGKVGMTGRLVSRQGSVLAKTFWADVLSLGGSYLRQSATATATSPLGVIETTKQDGEQLLKSVGGQAIERTTGRISQFFIKIAEQIYLVVEVLPGRKVTVLFEGGRLTRVTKDNFMEATKIAQNGVSTKDMEEDKNVNK
jgi:conjugal transfer pilus assembly protein TraB